MGSVEHDLRQHEATQDRLESRHAAYGDKVVESIVDDLFSGKKVDGWTIHDFCENCLTWEEVGALMMTYGAGALDLHYDLKQKLKGYIREWCCLGDGVDEVSERERLWEEDAKADARER